MTVESAEAASGGPDRGGGPRRPARTLGLPLSGALAARYLRSSRRDAYVSLLSVLAGGGIALGCAALVLVLAGLTGLQEFLRSDVLARTPHLEAELGRLSAEDASELLADLREIPGVLSAHRLVRGRGWLLVGGRALDVEIVGFEGELPAFFPTDAASRVSGLYLGDHLAARWGLSPGDPVELVSPRPTLTPIGPRPRLHADTVEGLFETGSTEQDDHRVALPFESGRRLVGDGSVRVEIRTDSLETALALAPEVRGALPAGARLKTWQDLNRPLFFALKLERLLMFVSVFLIVPVAALSLVTVLALLISSKREELGMLRAMGARAEQLRRAFLILGLTLGGGGMATGIATGAVGAWILDTFEVLAPPGDVYFVDHIPFVVRPVDVLAVVGATSFLTLLTTVWTSRRVARGGVVEALRR